MATYDTAQLTEIGLLMEQDTKGLVPHAVARAWAAAEQGVRNNVYGVTSNGHLASYTSIDAGVQAAARLLLGSPAYAETVDHLKAAKSAHSIAAAAMAIAQSPWRLGAAGVAKVGGTDPYYLSVFARYGLLERPRPAPAPAPAPIPEPTEPALDVKPAIDVDLAGPSPDTQTYTQQLFALEADPAAAKAAASAGHWPSEATETAWRRQTLVQLTAAEVGSGPVYNPRTDLTNGQIRAAVDWRDANPSLNLNPAYSAALDRADEVAGSAPAEHRLPWAGQSTALELVDEHSFGVTPVSGYYGTGEGTAPTA